MSKAIDCIRLAERLRAHLTGVLVREPHAAAPSPVVERVDRAQLEAVFAKRRPMMLRVARQIAGPIAAEDIVQRVQLATYQAQEIEVHNPDGYLVSATARAAKKHRAWLMKRAEVSLSEED